MPIPCYMSTCSVDLDADPLTGQLIANARLAPTGSLACDDEADPNGGLFVKVAGLAEDATSGIPPGDARTCGQGLSRLTDGSLFAFADGAAAVGYDGSGPSLIDITPNNNSYNTRINNAPLPIERSIDVTNPFDCPAWCFYTIGEMKVVADRLDPGHQPGENFYHIGTFELVVAGDLIAAVNRFDQHGIWDGAGNAPGHHYAINMHALFDLAANETKPVLHRATSISRYHVSLNGDDGSNGGVAFLHPAAVFIRKDQHV